jgi:archaellum component FlaG (FlaF/FlaG flagellin family)
MKLQDLLSMLRAQLDVNARIVNDPGLPSSDKQAAAERYHVLVPICAIVQDMLPEAESK